MTKPRWILETTILKGQPNEHLPDVIARHGMEYHVSQYKSKWIPPDDVPFKKEDGPVIIYSTYNYLRHLKDHGYDYLPGAFGVTDRLNCNFYMPNLPSEWLFNDDYLMLPWREFVRRRDWLEEKIGSYGVFVRPNSGFKTFAGTVIPYEDWDYEINSSQQLTSVMDDTLVLVSSLKNFYTEERFLIADGEVVTGSQYRIDNRFQTSPTYSESCHALAQMVARHSFQPDRVYTADIALTGMGPKIIELNSFACAGMYEWNLDLVVDAVSQVAEKEWKGE